MKRALTLAAVAVAVAVSITGVAAAAASPTVVTGAAIGVHDTSAVLNGRVDPNGQPTEYVFSYGPTVAYGLTTVVHSAGRGVKVVAVARTIAGLTPGTLYHYRITAVNGSGTGTGADRTFSTTGHPPAQVITGGALDVTKTAATVTGSINPNGAPTSWVVQYGPTPYGYETIAGAPLAAVSTPVPVAVRLAGISPRTLFHYRIVAYHGAAASYGADATFFTEPWQRPRPGLTARTRAVAPKRAPYTFTTAGSLRGGGFIPAPQRCTGTVAIRYDNGHRQVAFVVTPVAANCRFSVPATFRRLRGRRPASLTITVRYRGNGYLQPGSVTNRVTAG
ncbi:MAG: fibronectin type III domain-containing protein [Solirubrobacteraceae bacterium]